MPTGSNGSERTTVRDAAPINLMAVRRLEPAHFGHSDKELSLPIADIQEVNSPVPDARLDTLQHTKG
jgi:hypothetical protein